MGLESSEPADDDLVSVGFKNAFSRRLAELREALGHRKWESDQEEDLIDSILMMVKERIDKWDIPSVRFATRELFLNLYVFSENGILRDLYRVFGDLFARAYSQRHRLLDEMIRVFNHIMLETWLKSEDVSKGESAAEIMVNLGKEFLSKDLKVVQDCLAAIDNLAGDYFAPEILSKEILLTCAAFEIMEPPKRVEKFVEQAVDWIRINDQYAWDARIYTYLRDAIDYAKFEQEKFDLNIAKLKADYLDSILEGNIDSQVENYAEYITGEIVPSEDLSFKIEDLILLINAYESVRPTVAAEIGERISNKGKSRGEEIFKRIISESNFLKAVYGNGQMITTLDELIRFIESSADLDNQRIGFTTFGFSWIEFVRNIRDDEKASIKELLKKYRIKGDPELENDRLSFMMDDLVYVGEGQHEMRQLISFLREINKIVEIRGFSTDFDFRLRRLTAP